jgi:hypothetical protein
MFRIWIISGRNYVISRRCAVTDREWNTNRTRKYLGCSPICCSILYSSNIKYVIHGLYPLAHIKTILHLRELFSVKGKAALVLN